MLILTGAHGRRRSACGRAGRAWRAARVAAGRAGRLALPAVLERLAELELNEVLVEAGATLAGELLRQGLIDELLLYVGPELLGPEARALVSLPDPGALEQAPTLAFFGDAAAGRGPAAAVAAAAGVSAAPTGAERCSAESFRTSAACSRARQRGGDVRLVIAVQRLDLTPSASATVSACRAAA